MFSCMFLILSFLLLLFYIKQVGKIHDSRTYVFPKTGNKYFVNRHLLSKHPETGCWYDAVMYVGLKDNHRYVREKKDFYDTFVPLKQWKDENKER